MDAGLIVGLIHSEETEATMCRRTPELAKENKKMNRPKCSEKII